MAQYRVPHLHWLIPVVCAVILGFSLYGYLTQRESALAVLNSSSSGKVTQDAESASVAETNKPIVYNTFALRNSTLFGSPELSVAEIAPEELPKTALPLELQGIFLYQDLASSTALIREDGEIGRYQLGDELTGGRELVAIHEEAVVLSSADGMERLSFALEAPSFAATPENASSSSPLAAAVGPATATSPLAAAGPAAASPMVSESSPTAALPAALAAPLAAAGLPAKGPPPPGWQGRTARCVRACATNNAGAEDQNSCGAVGGGLCRFQPG